MSELSFWAYPAITFATLLATAALVYLIANSERNRPPSTTAPVTPTTSEDLIALAEGVKVISLSPDGDLYVKLSREDTRSLKGVMRDQIDKMSIDARTVALAALTDRLPK